MKSPYGSIGTSSPLEGEAKPLRLLGARQHVSLKMALSNQSDTQNAESETKRVAATGLLPPLRQLAIDPPSLTLSFGRGARIAGRRRARSWSRCPAGC